MKNTDDTLIKTAFEDQVYTLNGSMDDAFKTKKKQAFAKFEKTGFPSSKTETWKYSNLAAWTKAGYSPLKVAGTKSPSFDQEILGIKKANRLVFVNGVFNAEASKFIDKGILLSTVQEQMKLSDSFAEKYIDSIENHEQEPLHFLNTAFLENAPFIKVEKNTIVEHPLLILHLFDAVPEYGIVQNRLILEVEENAQLKCAEYFDSPTTSSFLYNDLQEIFVNESARLEWFKLENEKTAPIHVQSQKVKQEKNSYFKSWVFAKSPNKIRNNTYVQLVGRHTDTDILGLSLQAGDSHVDNHILIDHAAEDCRSNQLFKGTYTDKSTAIFNGKVLVRKDAQKTNAFQSNKNLLLSNNATINSKPELEIYADDVKCSHGATTGQLDENEVFYLQARGIDRERAIAILNQAFLAELLEYISIPELKSYMQIYFDQCFETA